MPTWFMLLWSLVLIVLVLGLAYWFTKYIIGRGGLGSYGPGKGTGGMKVLMRLSLGKEQQILLLQAGEQYLLLGATTAGISLLKELTQEEADACRPQREPPAGGEQMGFQAALRAVIKEKRSGVKK